MSKFSISALAFVVSIGLAGHGNASDAKDALNAGAQVVAVTTLKDGRLAITFQKDKAAIVCVMKNAGVGSIEIDACYTVR